MYTPKRELLKDIRYLENESKPKLVECNVEFFAMTTSTNLIKIFEIEKKPEVKQKSLSRNFVDTINKDKFSYVSFKSKNSKKMYR